MGLNRIVQVGRQGLIHDRNEDHVTAGAVVDSAARAAAESDGVRLVLGKGEFVDAGVFA